VSPVSQDEGRIGGRAGRGKRRDPRPACVQCGVQGTRWIRPGTDRGLVSGISSGIQYERVTRYQGKGSLSSDDLITWDIQRREAG
jgi:hypothetical protein